MSFGGDWFPVQLFGQSRYPLQHIDKPIEIPMGPPLQIRTKSIDILDTVCPTDGSGEFGIWGAKELDDWALGDLGT